MKSIVLLSLGACAMQAADLPELVLPQGVGVNIHFTRGHERDLDLIAAAGCKFIRRTLVGAARSARRANTPGPTTTN